MFRFSVLNRVQIPEPCSSSWDGMAGGGALRFCDSCQKTVHDLSSLTKRDAAKLLRENQGNLCARIVRDAQGRIEFRPEPRNGAMSRLVGLSLLGASSLAAAESRMCSLEVRVTDAFSRPIPGAAVKIDGEVKGRTDDKGIFVQQVPKGKLELRVDSPGFAGNPTNLDVRCHWKAPVVEKVELQVGSVFTGLVVVDNRSPARRAWQSVRSAFRRIRGS